MAKRTAKDGAELAGRIEQLRKLIEINEDVLRASKTLSAKQKQIAVAGVGSYRETLEPPNTSRGLDQIESDLLLAWNEMTGPDADAFWARVRAASLPFKPRDVLREVLARGKVRTRVEYDLLADTMEERAEEGSITQDERARLRAMMNQYEAKHGD
ncbi:MAG: hypothetical protein JO257_10045 [Deltaproteobacteria bacterium]|nr:hypothetical protein [Deltaproteobacteria bacterium]